MTHSAVHLRGPPTSARRDLSTTSQIVFVQPLLSPIIDPFE